MNIDNNKRLKNALRYCENQSIGELTYEKIKSQNSINSQIYKATAGKKSWAIKLYNPINSDNIATRCGRERIFYEYLEDINCQMCIRHLYCEESESWAVLEWCNGRSIKSITDKELIEISNFLVEINRFKDSFYDFNIPLASGASVSRDALISDVKIKYKIAKQKIYLSQDPELRCWFDSSVTSFFNQTVSDLAENKLWNDYRICTYLSPSDIGIHNILFVDSKPIFIDFEYAGRDDLSKTINDLVFNPNYVFSKKEESLLLNKLASNDIDDFWLDRYYATQELTKAKWLMLIIKKSKSINELRESVSYAKKYIQSLLCR